MKSGDKIKADTGENIGLRVKCGATGVKTFSYRYPSPITAKLVQVKIGSFPETSLAEARLKLQELKQIRRQGRCYWNGLRLHSLLFNYHFRNHFCIDFQSLSLLQGQVRDLPQHGALFLNVVGQRQ